MKVRWLVRTVFAALLSTILLIMGGVAPAAAHPRHEPDYGTLLNDLWKVAFRTQYDKESVGTARNLEIDPDGHLYLCARFDRALAPFTGSALKMSCRAKPGQLLVLIGTTFEWSFDEPGFDGPDAPPYTTAEQLRYAVNRSLDEAVARRFPEVLLDGRPLQLTRVVSPLTHVDRIADPNLLEISPASKKTDFLAAAWMTVIQAPAGVHTVEFRPTPTINATATIDARRCAGKASAA